MNDIIWFSIFCFAAFVSILIVMQVQQWRQNDKEDVTKIWVARGVLMYSPIILSGVICLCCEKTKLVDLIYPFHKSLGGVIEKIVFLGALTLILCFLLAILVSTLWGIASANSLKELEEMKEVRKKN